MNELQREDLKILKVLDKFCKDNDISYVLHAGTLLGAIRHKGYIPWDDDVDISMDRENFDKFEKLMSKSSLLEEGFSFQSNVYSKDYAFPFSKVRSNTMNIKENVVSTQKGFIGPWVDIFVLDNVPDDKVLRDKQFKKVFLYHNLISFFLLTRVTKNDKGIRKSIKALIEFVNKHLYKYYFFLNFLYKRRLHHMTKYNDQQTKYVAELGYMFHPSHKTFETMLIKRASIEDFEYTLFEDLLAPIPKNSGEVLTRNYGDYMTLPPEDEREVHQIEYIEF